MTRALYAFSGDPITYGHINIIERAAKLFSEVIVGIGTKSSKRGKYLFTEDERVDMAKVSLKHLSNVTVDHYPGMLADYAYKKGIDVVIRGVRGAEDTSAEKGIDHVGKDHHPGIETAVLFCRPDLETVSSSMVKEVQESQGDLRKYVPSYVKQCLEARISRQYVIGITGEIGTGKSCAAEKFVELAQKKGIPAYNIELDKLGHDIYISQEKGYKNAQKTIIDSFGPGIVSSDGSINRKALGDIVFNDYSKLKQLNEIMYEPLITMLHDEMRGKEGLIIFNAALIAEADWSYICNNNVVLVIADKKSQERRLSEVRNLTAYQIRRRLESQYTADMKMNKLNEAIERNHNGRLWILDSSDSAPLSNKELIFENVLNTLNVPNDPTCFRKAV